MIIKLRAFWKNPDFCPKGEMFKIGYIDFTIPVDGEPERQLTDSPTLVGLMASSNEKVGIVDADECTIMQFTGLLDKNGKEIFEGDIIQCNDGSVGAIAYRANEDSIGFFIKWHRKKTNWNDYIHARIKELEVIGNLHETPNLLK